MKKILLFLISFVQKTNEFISKSAPVIATFSLVLFMQVTRAQAPTNPPGTYYTSWLGNTFMDANNQHALVTEAIDGVCVSPNGHVFSAGYAESWGGEETFSSSDGSFLGKYDRMTSDIGGNDAANSVAADNNYAYFGTGGNGLVRAEHNGVQNYTYYLSGKSITGVFIKGTTLYASNFSDGTILVYSLPGMSLIRTISCQYPTRLTVDNNNNIWVVIWDNTSAQPPSDGPIWWGSKIRSFSSSGAAGAEITGFEKPLSVAVNSSNQLLVGGLNSHCQVWKYDISGTPAKVGTFGANGGIFSGTAGAFTNSAKLHWIKSIAVDASDNIYTACCYGTFWGGCVEKWTSGGALLWRNFAGTSLDCAGIDPLNENEVYSKYHHYSLDYSKTTAGTEWSLKGFTVNRFKYPNDIRVDHLTDVGSRSLGAGAFRIGGKLFVARSHQEGYECELFRQETSTDGEVLVPSFKLGSGSDANNHFYNSSTKTWYDKPKKDNLYNQYWCIANNGDLITVGDNDNVIIHYKYGGLDSNNNPIWDASNCTVSSVPEFTYDVRKIYYDSVADVMYVTGDEPDGQWGNFAKIRRYNNWSTGNRTSAYTVSNLPWDDINYTPEINWGGGAPIAFTAAGDYLFILYGYGHIRILNKSNGSLVGTLQQNINGWTGGGGQVDASYGLSAFKRSNGEYILLFENAAFANIMMHRWCPTGNCITLTNIQNPTREENAFSLYPNPANKSTRISFVTGKAQEVSLKVYDFLGREVSSLVDQKNLLAGKHEYELSLHTGGIYFIKLIAGEKQTIHKVVFNNY